MVSVRGYSLRWWSRGRRRSKRKRRRGAKTGVPTQCSAATSGSIRLFIDCEMLLDQTIHVTAVALSQLPISTK